MYVGRPTHILLSMCRFRSLAQKWCTYTTIPINKNNKKSGLCSATKPETAVNNHNSTNNYDSPLLLCGPPCRPPRGKMAQTWILSTVTDSQPKQLPTKMPSLAQGWKHSCLQPVCTITELHWAHRTKQKPHFVQNHLVTFFMIVTVCCN